MSNQLKAVKLTGTTNGDGALTVKAPRSILGMLLAVEWIDGDLTDGVDAVLSVTDTPSGADNTLLTLTNANADAWYYPEVATCTNTGEAGGNTTPMLINGTLKLVIASGGAAHTGGCIAYYTSY